jgi:hypothetical protein
MSVILRKPILIGGVSLSLALWLWDSLQHSIIEAGEWTVLGVMAIGTGFWLLKSKTSQKKIANTLSQPLTLAMVKKELATGEHIINILQEEAPERDIRDLQQQKAELTKLLEKPELKLVITGGRKVGKTSLKQILDKQDFATQLTVVETEALLTATESTELNTTETALTSDLVLFLVAGDLTDGEWKIVQKLRTQYQRVLIVLNKQDQYSLEERIYIQQQIQDRVKEIITSEDIVTTTVAPAPVKVRQENQDGSIQEWMEEQPAVIEELQKRLNVILIQEKEQLLWGTTWRAAKKLQQEAQATLNQVRRERALPLIEQYQWIAAAAAFANPIAALDLLAAAAVNTQMLIELSNIYGQKFSFDQAQNATGTLGKLMVQLGLVELSTNAIATILKSNAFTYVAGGAVQGVSAAYLTRIVGLSLIEYYQEQEINLNQKGEFNLNKLIEKLKQVFAQNQRTAFLSGFVPQALNHFAKDLSISQSSCTTV